MNKSVLKIFIRCPNWVGDVVMATPVFKCIRASFPDAFITAGMRKYVHGVVEDSPYFDSIIYCEDKTFWGFWRTVRDIRADHFDKAVMLTNSTHAFLSVYLSGVREIYGYKINLQKYFISKGPEPVVRNGREKLLPMTLHYMEICKAMGLEADAPSTELFSRKELDEEAERIFGQHGIDRKDTVVGINPGAKFGSSKCWPPEHFAKLADMVTEKFGFKVVIFAGPGEDDIARKIESLCKHGIINTGPDRINLSLLKPMIRRCRLLVTNDTGPRHYATAFKVPAIVIMGPTNPAYTEYGLDITTILRADVDCSPCHRHVCTSDHRCMTSISPEMVFKEVEKILDASVVL